MSTETQEPAYMAQIRVIGQRLDGLDKRLAVLNLHAEGGPDVVATLGTNWQTVDGRPGVWAFAVPHRSGDPGLFVCLFDVEPGAHFECSSMRESRLVVTLAGDATLNGRPLPPGEATYLAPGQPVSWYTVGGYVCVSIYDVPPREQDVYDPDFLNLLPTS